MPDVSNVSVTEAETAIAEAGLTLGTVVQVSSCTTAAEKVCGLTASSGGYINQNFPVDIYVSTGSSGDGERYPFSVACRSDLEMLNDQSTVHYRLTRDIYQNLLKPCSDPAAYRFGGVLDGGGFTIFNLFQIGDGRSGLLGDVYGKVERLNLENCMIYSLDGFTCGGICVSNQGVIKDCQMSGLVIGGYPYGESAGGICGFNENGILEDCSSSAAIIGGGESTGGLCGESTGYDSKIIGCNSSGMVIGSNYTGGLSGKITGKVLRCHSSCQVFGRDRTGGLIGSNGLGYYSNGLTSECSSTGDVEGTEWVGGLVGLNTKDVKASFSSGKVTAIDCVGGLCGFNAGSITRSYSTGEVDGITQIGGLCGYNYNGELYMTYSCGRVTGSDAWSTGGLCGLTNYDGLKDNFWDIESSGQTASACGIGKTTAKMKSKSTFIDAGWLMADFETGSTGWYMPKDSRPLLYWQKPTAKRLPDVTNMTVEDAKAALLAAGFNFNSLIRVHSMSVPPGEIAGLSASIGEYYDAESRSIDIYLSDGSTGDGSELNPYQVGCEADLVYLAQSGDRSAAYMLTADIFLSSPDCTGAFKAIGEFSGMFDGNGHTITNLYLHDNSMESGFFTRLNGDVKNLCLTNCLVRNSGNDSSCGIICGTNYGHIYKCYAQGTISSYGKSGGICGLNNGIIEGSQAECNVSGKISGGMCGFQGGEIIDSKANAYVRAESIVGGLCGINNRGEIRGCQATGQVQSEIIAGGLCGDNYQGSIDNSWSSCLVEGGDFAGGLCGRNLGYVYSSCADSDTRGVNAGGLCGHNESVLRHCYSEGEVTGIETGGGICGDNGGLIENVYSAAKVNDAIFSGGICGIQMGDNAEIKNSFWNTEVCLKGFNLDDGAPGLISNTHGAGTEEMYLQSTFTNAGWDFAGEYENGLHDFWHMTKPGLDYPKLRWQMPYPGDSAGSYGIDLADLGAFSRAWRCTSGDTDWNQLCDAALPKDGIIDESDLAVLAKNWLAEGWRPLYAGDAAGDFGVNLVDLAAFSQSWQKFYDDPEFNRNLDIIRDGKIDGGDLALFAQNWLSGTQR